MTSRKSPDVVDNVRPLNATQTRNLEKIVQNDFNQLRSEIESFAADQIKAKTEELRAETKDELKREYKKRGRKIIAKYKRDAKDLIEEAAAHGLQLKLAVVKDRYSGDDDTVSITDNGLAKRIQEATAEIEGDRDRALLKLAAQRGKSLREVYQASITAQAEQVLDTIPTASQLMLEASREQTTETPKGEIE